MKTYDFAFMIQLENGDYIVSDYGTQFSTARYNGCYYDSFKMFDKDPFAGNADYTLAKTIGDVKVYRHAAK